MYQFWPDLRYFFINSPDNSLKKDIYATITVQILKKVGDVICLV